MSEKPPPRPLPRFMPNRPNVVKRQMSSSLSVPNIAEKFREEKRRQIPPPEKKRPVRQRQTLILEDKPRNQRVSGGDMFKYSPSVPNVMNFDDDAIEDESGGAVTLPLVPKTSAPRTAAEILTSTGQDKVILVQLPTALPIMYPNSAKQMEYNPLFAAADGKIGQIQIHRSGKITANFGGIPLDVSAGIATSCTQAVCVKRENGLDYFEVQGGKLKISVNVDDLLK